MNPLLSLLINSLVTRGVAKATENTPLSFIGKGLDYLDPFSYFKTTDKGLDSLSSKLGDFIAPNRFGTSLQEYERFSIPYDIEQGKGAFGNVIDSIYGPGGVMQGYNAISAFGKGPVESIENRITKITNRSLPQTDYSRQLIENLKAAKNQLTLGSTYGQDDGITTSDDKITSTGVNLNALYDDLGQSGGGSDSSGWSGGSGSDWGGGFSTSSSGTEETF